MVDGARDVEIYRVPCKNVPAHWEDRQEVRSEDQGAQERSALSQLVHRPEPPGQGRAV